MSFGLWFKFYTDDCYLHICEQIVLDNDGLLTDTITKEMKDDCNS